MSQCSICSLRGCSRTVRNISSFAYQCSHQHAICLARTDLTSYILNSFFLVSYHFRSISTIEGFPYKQGRSFSRDCITAKHFFFSEIESHTTSETRVTGHSNSFLPFLGGVGGVGHSRKPCVHFICPDLDFLYCSSGDYYRCNIQCISVTAPRCHEHHKELLSGGQK